MSKVQEFITEEPNNILFLHKNVNNIIIRIDKGYLNKKNMLPVGNNKVNI